MLRLGASVTVCCALTGESAAVLRHLLEEEGATVAAVERSGRGSTYVHDRRAGHRDRIAEEDGDPLARHDLDELYSLTIREGMAAGFAVLSGPDGEAVLPADGVDVLKVSDDELKADGAVRDNSMPAIMKAMRDLRDRGRIQ